MWQIVASTRTRCSLSVSLEVASGHSIGNSEKKVQKAPDLNTIYQLSWFIHIHLHSISLSNVNVRQCLWGVWQSPQHPTLAQTKQPWRSWSEHEVTKQSRNISKHQKTQNTIKHQDVARRGSILILCDSRYLSIFHWFHDSLWFLVQTTSSADTLILTHGRFLCAARSKISKISKVRCAKWSKWSKWSGLRLTSCVPPSRHSAQPAPPRWQSRPIGRKPAMPATKQWCVEPGWTRWISVNLRNLEWRPSTFKNHVIPPQNMGLYALVRPTSCSRMTPSISVMVYGHGPSREAKMRTWLTCCTVKSPQSLVITSHHQMCISLRLAAV